MNRSRLFLVPVLLAAASCSAAPSTLTDAERAAAAEEARAASVALVDAMKRHDAEAVLGFYDLGEGFVYVGCTNFVLEGERFAQILRMYHRQNPDQPFAMDVVSVRVVESGAAAVLLQGTSGDTVQLFTTRILRRGDDGSWKVVYEHESWPGCKAPSGPHPGTAAEELDTLPSDVP